MTTLKRHHLNHLKHLSSFVLTTNMTSPGSITISGVAILQSPRPVDPERGPRNVVFDANFCIVEGSQTVTMALLRYFSPKEMMDVIQNIASKTFQKAFIVANVRYHSFLFPYSHVVNADIFHHARKQYCTFHIRFQRIRLRLHW